jgi:hypothetical protein
VTPVHPLAFEATIGRGTTAKCKASTPLVVRLNSCEQMENFVRFCHSCIPGSRRVASGTDTLAHPFPESELKGVEVVHLQVGGDGWVRGDGW